MYVIAAVAQGYVILVPCYDYCYHPALSLCVHTLEVCYSNTLDLLASGVGHADYSMSIMTSMSLSYVCYASTLDLLASGVGPCRLQYEYNDLLVLILCMLCQHVRPLS